MIRQDFPEVASQILDQVMPVTMERHESDSLIQLEGDFNVTSAAELKRILLEELTSGRELQVNLEHVGEIDITVLQLLWAAQRDAARGGAGIAICMSEAAGKAAREAGFGPFAGPAVQGDGWPR